MSTVERLLSAKTVFFSGSTFIWGRITLSRCGVNVSDSSPAPRGRRSAHSRSASSPPQEFPALERGGRGGGDEIYCYILALLPVLLYYCNRYHHYHSYCHFYGLTHDVFVI